MKQPHPCVLDKILGGSYVDAQFTIKLALKLKKCKSWDGGGHPPEKAVWVYQAIKIPFSHFFRSLDSRLQHDSVL